MESLKKIFLRNYTIHLSKFSLKKHILFWIMHVLLIYLCLKNRNGDYQSMSLRPKKCSQSCRSCQIPQPRLAMKNLITKINLSSYKLWLRYFFNFKYLSNIRYDRRGRIMFRWLKWWFFLQNCWIMWVIWNLDIQSRIKKYVSKKEKCQSKRNKNDSTKGGCF